MSYLAGIDPTIYTQTTQSGTFAITPSNFLIMGNPNAGGFTWTLPSAVGLNGKMYAFKNINSATTNFNAITVDTTSAQTIDGVTSKTLVSQNEEMWVISDNANWRVIHRYIPMVPIAFTPVGSWTTNVTPTGVMVREGMYGVFTVKYLCTGAPDNAALTVNLPFSLTFNTSAYPALDAGLVNVGGGNGTNAGTSAEVYSVSYESSTSVGAYYQSSVVAVKTAVAQAAPFAWNTADFITLNYKVAITGWSS